MLSAIFATFALLSVILGLPVIHKDKPKAFTGVQSADGKIGYLPVNRGWAAFEFGCVGSTTTIALNLFCSGYLNITDLFCSGDRFEIFDNGVCLGETSCPTFNNCHSNTTCPKYAQSHSEWSSGSWYLPAGFHNITLKVIESAYHFGNGAIRADTYSHYHGEDKVISSSRHQIEHCNVKQCSADNEEYVFVDTQVPRCQAEEVCSSLGLYLANVDSENFNQATKVAYKCASGNIVEAWIDDWKGEEYSGSCLTVKTGGKSKNGIIGTPECCSEKRSVLCQRQPCGHPSVPYQCNECHPPRYCHGHRCHHRHWKTLTVTESFTEFATRTTTETTTKTTTSTDSTTSTTTEPTTTTTTSTDSTTTTTTSTEPTTTTTTSTDSTTTTTTSTDSTTTTSTTTESTTTTTTSTEPTTTTFSTTESTSSTISTTTTTTEPTTTTTTETTTTTTTAT